jgi:GH15 family glucan-1,4-alpha-glucosidase
VGRPVVLSNGQLFVGLDESGLVHDFYYPYVGLENLSNSRHSQHKIGVWADGNFKWVDNKTWAVETNFEADALVSNITAHSDELNVTLKMHDFVDVEYNAFVRRIEVCNDEPHEREIRLFTHQVFQISRAGRADTALFVPDDKYILDYKGRCCLLAAGKLTDGGDFDQFAVGNYGIEGKSGTYGDAEDGELSGNLVEHGGVDSVLRFSKRVPGDKSYNVDYWVVAADSQNDAQIVHTYLKYYPIADRLQHARDYWHAWLATSHEQLQTIPKSYRDEVQKSMLVIKAHCDERGSVLASGDSSIFNFGRDYYCYCWPRDAAMAVWPLIRMGQYEEAKKFFEFSRDTMHRDGYLMHKYQPDRSIGSSWHPLVHNRHKELAIQEDETAIVVFMINEYYECSHDHVFVENYYDTFIEPCARFMNNFIDERTGLPHASYDLWEQKFLTNTYTVCTVIAGLKAAAKLAGVTDHPEDMVRWKKTADSIANALSVFYHPDGYFRKGFWLNPDDGNLEYDDTIDISNLYGPYMFGGLPLDDYRMRGTLKHVDKSLAGTSPIGGVIRFPGDDYFLTKPYAGNPWIVCSLWLAQYYQALDKHDEATKLLDWAMARTVTSGVLSEQFDPEDGQPLGVAPLVWSHAEVINTALDLADIK